MKKISILLFLPLLFSCANQSPVQNSMSFSQAKGLYDQQWVQHKDDEKYISFVGEWLRFKNTNSNPFEARCYFATDAKERFILIQNEKGIIQELIAENDNRKTRCFRKELVGNKYPRPPFAPFFTVLTMGAP
ncbi:MAG: hypothetical protein AAGC78_17040 [Cellvibrio sp.]|uniref:hypothetical protein n=1 Tax=Cellvibrio sp. TaxID=1965322 RepID=UPI0031AD396C